MLPRSGIAQAPTSIREPAPSARAGGGQALRQPGIMTHHFKAVVAKQVLERENISTIAEVIDREGVAEFMGMRLDPQFLPEFRDKQP